LLKAKQDERDCGRREHDPEKVNPDAGLARDRRQAITQDQDDDRQEDDQPIRVAPAQGRGEEAGDDEGDRAGDRGDARQHTQRPFLLSAVVVRGDQHHQRRHSRGGGNSRDRLSSVHGARVGAGRHQTHRHTVRDDAYLEQATLAHEFADLRAKHDERGDEHRVEEERGCRGGRRRAQVFRERPERNGQGADVNGHLKLSEDDDDQWQPGRPDSALVSKGGVGSQIWWCCQVIHF
jgi:hypothetical protein